VVSIAPGQRPSPGHPLPQQLNSASSTRSSTLELYTLLGSKAQVNLFLSLCLPNLSAHLRPVHLLGLGRGALKFCQEASHPPSVAWWPAALSYPGLWGSCRCPMEVAISLLRARCSLAPCGEPGAPMLKERSMGKMARCCQGRAESGPPSHR
jgi:hypothetical protein